MDEYLIEILCKTGTMYVPVKAFSKTDALEIVRASETYRKLVERKLIKEDGK